MFKLFPYFTVSEGPSVGPLLTLNVFGFNSIKKLSTVNFIKNKLFFNQGFLPYMSSSYLKEYL